jgi:hypothetical protein
MKKTLGAILYLTQEGDRLVLQFVRQNEDTVFASQLMEKRRAKSEVRRLARIMKLRKGRRTDAWFSSDWESGPRRPSKQGSQRAR